MILGAFNSAYPRWSLWLLWIGIMAVSAVGLTRYRIDNDIARWTPGLQARAADTYVVVGYERTSTIQETLQRSLQALTEVASVQPIHGDGELDGLLVLATPDTEGQDLVEAIERAIQHDGVQLPMAGPPVFRRALDDWSQRGLPLASGLTLLIGSLAMGFTTRRPRPVCETVFAVFSAQLVLVGLISLTNTPMDMVLSMTPPLLMGLGFSFAAHRAVRRDVNRAVVLSMASTSIAMSTFLFSDFLPLRQFGGWGAAGVVLTWLAVMLLVTPPRDDQVPATQQATAIVMRRRRHVLVTFAAAMVTAAGFAVLPLLALEEDTLSYFPADARVVQDYRAIDADLTGTLPFEVLVDPNAADPTQRLMSTAGVRWVQPADTDRGSAATIYLGLADSDAVPQLAAAQGAWHSWAHLHDTTLLWRGVAAQIDHICRSVWRTACWALPAMLVVAGASAWLIDRRPFAIFATVWVNAIPIAVLGLGLFFANQPLGLPTVIVSALGVGVALDDTLHLLVECKRSGSFVSAVRQCRRPCVGSSLALAGCMLTFLACPFRPTAEFGFWVALAVIAALVADLFVLPALEMTFKTPSVPGSKSVSLQ